MILWFKSWVRFVLIVPFHLFCVWVFNMYGGLDVGCLPKPLQKWMLWWPFWTLLGVSLGGVHDSRLKHVSRSSAGLVQGAKELGRPCRGFGSWDKSNARMSIQWFVGPQNHMYSKVVLNRSSFKNSIRSIKTSWASHTRNDWLKGTNTKI